MKIALIGDLHFGVKDDDPWIHKKMYNELVRIRDYCVDNNIKHILQAGDIFDTRKAISHKTMEFVRTSIVPLFIDTDITIHAIVGNHDAKYKDTIIPNALSEVLGKYKFFDIIENPKQLEFDGLTIDMIPWICKNNQDEIFKFIENSNSEYCLGHFELSGFYYYPGFKSHGTSTEFLSKYTYVYSGHFHTISSNFNIRYIGTPYTITNNDVNDVRGFWVLDTETKKDVFIKNPVMNHYKLFFDADTWDDDPKNYKDCSVTLIVTKEEGKIKLDKILDKFEKYAHIFKYSILPEKQDIVENEESNNEVQETTLDIINLEISSLTEDDITKKDVKKYFDELYLTAINN